MSTIRQVLFLPTSREVKYEGKTAIETFFWRFGDLIQGGAIYAGIHWFELGIPGFAVGNALLAAVWTAVAFFIAKEYCRIVAENGTSQPPELVNPIPDCEVAPGAMVDITLHPQTFVDPDPGDVIRLYATLDDDRPLPAWLVFDANAGRFHGTAPDNIDALQIKVTAMDFEDLFATDHFTIRFTHT